MKHLIFITIIFFWKILPFKKKMSKSLNRFPGLKEKLYKDLRHNGVMKVEFESTSFHIYNPGFTTIENEIFWNGLNGWEKISIGIWKELSKKSAVILDIGANTGIYSLIASAVNPSAEVYSFEPVKRTASLLEHNLSLNPEFNICAIEKAVSNTNGIAEFYDVDAVSQYSASLNSKMLENIPNQISYSVETIRLDDLEQLKGKKVDLIKLDVEMHEPEAIQGMINIINDHKPAILIEILTDEIGQNIETLIAGLDYEFFNIDEINEPEKVEHLQKSNHYNFLLICKSR